MIFTCMKYCPDRENHLDQGNKIIGITAPYTLLFDGQFDGFLVCKGILDGCNDIAMSIVKTHGCT